MTSLFKNVNAQVECELKSRIKDIAETVWPVEENIKVLTSKQDNFLYSLIVAKAFSQQHSTANTTSSVCVLLRGDATHTTTESALVDLNERVATKFEELLGAESQIADSQITLALSAETGCDRSNDIKAETEGCGTVDDEAVHVDGYPRDSGQSHKGKEAQDENEVAPGDLEKDFISLYDNNDILEIPAAPAQTTADVPEIRSVELDDDLHSVCWSDLVDIDDDLPSVCWSDLVDLEKQMGKWPFKPDEFGKFAGMCGRPDRHMRFMSRIEAWVDETRLPESQAFQKCATIPDYYVPDEPEKARHAPRHVDDSVYYVDDESDDCWDSISQRYVAQSCAEEEEEEEEEKGEEKEEAGEEQEEEKWNGMSDY